MFNKVTESTSKFVQEMRIKDARGRRLYVNQKERERFLEKAKELDEPKHRLFCDVLHWSGCRISEALELSPERVMIDEYAITFRTLKKRLVTRSGQRKLPQYRDVPVPKELIENLDIVFKIRKAQRTRKGLDALFWPNLNDPTRPMSRTTGWNIIKRVFAALDIEGAHTTPKGFRHGYGVAMTLAGMDVYKLAQYLGHASADTTQIYREAVGEDDHRYAMGYWEKVKELSSR